MSPGIGRSAPGSEPESTDPVRTGFPMGSPGFTVPLPAGCGSCARTGKVAKPRTVGGTAVKVVLSAGSSPRRVRCSTTCMPAASRTLCVGRLTVLMSSRLAESIPTRAPQHGAPPPSTAPSNAWASIGPWPSKTTAGSKAHRSSASAERSSPERKRWAGRRGRCRCS